MKKHINPQPTFPGEFRSSCPVASLLDIVGDKWTLIVVRDIFLNKHRYGDFLTSSEAIPTNILADRLKRLEAAGIVKRELYQDNPPRAEYFLTSRGADLEPVLRAMLLWGRSIYQASRIQKRLIHLKLKTEIYVEIVASDLDAGKQPDANGKLFWPVIDYPAFYSPMSAMQLTRHRISLIP